MSLIADDRKLLRKESIWPTDVRTDVIAFFDLAEDRGEAFRLSRKKVLKACTVSITKMNDTAGSMSMELSADWDNLLDQCM